VGEDSKKRAKLNFSHGETLKGAGDENPGTKGGGCPTRAQRFAASEEGKRSWVNRVKGVPK